MKNWSSALIAILMGGLLTTTSAPALAVTPGAAGCELTGINGASSAGTSANPYRVSTPDELAEIEDCDGTTNKYFQLVNDIDLQGLAWRPIAAASTPSGSIVSNQFKGHLDGGGFKITNLTTSDDYVGGLFGVIRGNNGGDKSTVQNLTIQGSVTGGAFGLEARYSSFSNVTLNVDVRRNPSAATSGVGVALGGLAASGYNVEATSISLVASGGFGLNGIVGDSNATYLGGLFGVTGDFNSDTTPNRFADVRIRTYIGAPRNNADLGGIIADAGHQNEVHGARISVTLDGGFASSQNISRQFGGVASSVRGGDWLTVSNTVVEALVILPNTSANRDFNAGGMVGGGPGTAFIYSSSAILHAHLPKDGSMGNNSFIGGFLGVSGDGAQIHESYSSLNVTSEASDISRLKSGAFVGYVSSGESLTGSNNFFNASSSDLASTEVGDDSAAASSTLVATGLTMDQIVPTTFANAGWDIASSSTSFDATTDWNICDHPTPSQVGPETCGPLFLGGKVSRSGLGVELFFGSPIQTSSLPSQSSLQILANGTQVGLEAPVASSFGTSNSLAVSFSGQTEFDSGVVILGSYSKPQSGVVMESLSAREIPSFPLTRFANSSVLLPPTGSISLVSNGTTTASLQVLCTADCGGGTSFTYSITVEKTGTGVVDVTSNDSGLITGLQPSTSYTAKATVTFNGRTSTQVSVAFSTQRPEATISAVTLNGQEVTGVISCINCGADPTTTSFMATPTAGGASVSSSSPVLSGLATATSYSISVRVTFMGAESLEVTWSSTILTAADPMPAITSINPASVVTSGGTEVTVMGTNFTGAAVSVDGIAVSPLTIVSATELKFTSPTGSAGNSIVRVTNAGGFDEVTLVYTAPPAPSNPGSAPPIMITTPTITEFSSREISASGAEVTATGLRLENVSVLTLGGITVTIVANTATSITFTTGEMPVGVWDLRLVGPNGTLVFQQAIEVVEATAIVGESTGEFLGYTWTLKFVGNSRSLSDAQAAHLTRRLNPSAETIICWGYTTAENPNAWAIAHATQRAQAACDMASANNSEVKTVVRLRYGVEKSWAMRSALQFWR